MNDANASGIGVLSLCAALRVDAVCRRFEASWRAGAQPRLEDYLAQAEGPEQQALLGELLRLELDYRIRSGQVPTLDEYQSRFPHAAELIGCLLATTEPSKQTGPLCPGPEQLRELLSDRLTAVEQQGLISHVDSCPNCLATLAQLAAGSARSLLDLLRKSNAALPDRLRSLREKPPPTPEDETPVTRAPASGDGRPAGVLLVTAEVEGAQVPGYDIIAELGRGGMGVVYKARQVGLNRVCALKMILHARHAGVETLQRFRAEAQAIARLGHPNIVEVYDFGTHEGLPFFSLEFCEGGSLDRKLAGTPVKPTEAAALLRTLAVAMQAAHQASVIHRDLKPANVLLSADGTPKITDFGLAKKLDEDPSAGVAQEGVVQTHTGAILGTPAYMAPEQARASKDIGPSADIWALGAILYECLTGRPPFKAATPFDTICQVLNEEPVPPRRLNAQVPADLETICLKCLHKDPARRYRSARELADDLRRFLAGEPIRARPSSAWERAVKWARRRPTAAALAGTAVVALVAVLTGLVFSTLYANQRSHLLERQMERRNQADERFSEATAAEADRRLADAETKMVEALALLKAEPNLADTDLRARIEDRLHHIRTQIKELADRRDRRDTLQSAIKQLYKDRDALLFHSLGVVDSEQRANRKAILEKAPAALGPFTLSSATPAQGVDRTFESFTPSFESAEQRRQVAGWCFEVLLIWARALADSGKHAEALTLLARAKGLGAAQKLPPARILHEQRGRSLAAQGNEAAARQERARAKTVTPNSALDHFMLALDSYKRQDADQALRDCALALRLQPDDFWPQYLAALCHLRAGRWASANVWLTACIGRRPGYFWPWVQRATARVELTNRLQMHARDRQVRIRADAQAREAQEDLDQAQKLLPAGDRLAAYVVRMVRGRLAAVRQRWTEARDEYRKALADQPPDVCHAHIQLAEVQRRLKNLDAALAELYRAIDRQPAAARLYHMRAQVHQERGDRARARRDLAEAIRHADPKNREPWLAGVHVELGYLKHLAGQYDEALKDFAAALKVVEDYPDAHRQRAQTLLAKGRYAEAGQALDAYLKVERNPPTIVLQARGLVCARLRDYPGAIEAYTLALERHRDVKTLSYRGWAHLLAQAFLLARADFEEALWKQPRHPEALCGRGQLRVLRGEVDQAIKDAEAALKHGQPSGELLCGVACIYARAALQMESPGRGKAASRRRLYEARAVALVEKALRLVKPGQRRQFWREQVLQDPTLRTIVPPRLAERDDDVTP
jgi:tetratricopeptide (TPR) repeat protein